MIIQVLVDKGCHEHTCAHFEARDNGILYIYRTWEVHEMGTYYELATAYAPGIWHQVIRKEEA
jgi:hypothetical protein